MATNYVALARRYAEMEGLDPNIFVRQIRQESGFNPRARSPAGATGIAQIMPATAKAWGVNPNDPKQSLRAAARNMATYVRKYGSYENALRAYNAGPGAIEKSKGYSETNHYVQTILRGREPGKLGNRSSSTAPKRSTGPTIPGVSPTPIGPSAAEQRSSLLGQYLAVRGRPGALAGLGYGLANVREPEQPEAPAPSFGVPDRPSTSSSTRLGTFKIEGPNPDRLKPQLVSFARRVAGIYGKPLRGSDGTGHSYRTATGGVSQHSTGNATDIPASGKELLRMGRAALIAAGMPRSQAMKAQGGLYNVGKHQIIFHDRKRLSGSPHDDHLHISAR